MPNSSQLRRKRIYRAAIAPKAFLGNSEVTKDLPISDNSGEFTKSFFINSGPPIDAHASIDDREFQQISAHDVPVPSGSFITDYDGISATINRLTNAFLSAKDRLNWAGHTIRQQEIELHKKECFLADYENRERPKPLRPVPFYEEPTESRNVTFIYDDTIKLMGIIWAGITAGAFILMCLYKLIF